MFGALCAGCTGYVIHAPARGWVHVDGGGPIWQRCDCGWTGSEAIDLGCCPRCGTTKNLRDDHVAQPDRGVA